MKREVKKTKDKDWSKLEVALGVSFKDRSLLAQAFTHRSYLNENRAAALAHNERLEFLGDAVLELLVSDYLFGQYAEATEGDLTVYRAALVNTGELARAAEALAISDYLLLSRGEARDTGRARQTILANTFEALLGAIYLDQGYEAARLFTRRFLFPRLAEILASKRWQDDKSLFQEKSQEAESVTPRYEVLNQTGPDHNKTFTVALYLGEAEVARGTGHSKQEAEQAAARAGLKRRGWEK